MRINPADYLDTKEIREANRTAYNKLSEKDRQNINRICNLVILELENRRGRTTGMGAETVLEILSALYQHEKRTGQVLFGSTHV